MAAKTPKSAPLKTVSLALQGGGALGAFTWGVLDRLVEDGRVGIEAISGASAGAMNAVVFCEGMVEGGPEGARRALRQFWEGIARASDANPYRQTPLQAMLYSAMGPWGDMLAAPWRTWLSAVSSASSPYETNPLNINPLQDLLEELVDFNRVRKDGAIALYVAATQVETGRVRVFTNAELSARHVLASACLPQMFQAVEIGGEHFWDGGYMGNPPLFPLFDTRETRDIVIVQINPVERKAIPHSAADIAARVNEITFNASLLRELRAIEFVTRLLDEGRVPEDRYRRMLVHRIHNEAALDTLGVSAKLNTDMSFFESLFEAGRQSCASWLSRHFDDLGATCTLDLRMMFEGELGPPLPRSPK